MATDLIYKVPVRVIWLQTAIYKYRCPGRPNKRTNHSRQGADNIKERKIFSPPISGKNWRTESYLLAGSGHGRMFWMILMAYMSAKLINCT